MEPKVDITLRKQLVQNKWTHTVFKKQNVTLERSLADPTISLLVFGKNSKAKTKIQITRNVNKIHKNFLETDGRATIMFVSPAMQCMLATSEPTSSSRSSLVKLIKIIQYLADGHELKSLQTTSKAKITATNSEQLIWQKLKMTLNLSTEQSYLTHLNLEGRLLTELPREIAELSLKELRLSNNVLGVYCTWWSWLDGRICQTLQVLSLDNNKLTSFPLQIIGCRSLLHLSLSNNNLSHLPDTLFLDYPGPKLESLYISNNPKLRTLPYAVKQCHLKTLDVSGSLVESLETKEKINERYIQLLDLAGTAVLRNRIFFNSQILPRDLIELLYRARLCWFCKKVATFSRFPFKTETMRMYYSSLKVREIIRDNSPSFQTESIHCMCATPTKIHVQPGHIAAHLKWKDSPVHTGLKGPFMDVKFFTDPLIDFRLPSLYVVYWPAQKILRNEVNLETLPRLESTIVIADRNVETLEHYSKLQQTLCSSEYQLVPVGNALELPLVLQQLSQANLTSTPGSTFRANQTSRPPDKHQLQMLLNVPGLGKQKAVKLLEVFGSVQKIALSSLDVLVPVVGATMAAHVFRFFNDPIHR